MQIAICGVIIKEPVALSKAAPPVRSLIALGARERPMIATVGPITTGGISLSIHATPANFTMIAMITYTRPAKTAPRTKPRKPSCMETPPAKAESMEPMKANEEPRNTGLRNLVNKRYTSVPTPAPMSAEDGVRPLPTIFGTAMVAAIIASSCCTANTSIWPNFMELLRGLSLTSYTSFISDTFLFV